MLEEVLGALDSITWYNCLAERLIQIKKDIINTKESQFIVPDDIYDDERINLIWMILVCMYGDYGTSPRSGWLELKNKEKIINFIDKVTTTYREEGE